MTAYGLFSFHGVRVKIVALDTESEHVLSDLSEDVRFFLTDFSDTAQIELRLSSKPLLSARRSWPLFRARMCRVSLSDGRRRCDYGDGTETINRWEGLTRVMEIHSLRREELHEVAYLALLSIVGESLDHLGLHRVHAFGLRMQARTALVILPQGGGKSALALLLGNKAEIFSDEIPLLKNGELFPFPIRLALRPEVAQALEIPLQNSRLFRHKKFPAKLVFPIPRERVADPSKLELILIGRRVMNSRPRIYPARRWQSFFALLNSMVVGLGVPQMAEHFLRWDAGLGMIFLARLRTALTAAGRSSAFVFEVGTDARENARVLEEFMSTGQGK